MRGAPTTAESRVAAARPLERGMASERRCPASGPDGITPRPAGTTEERTARAFCHRVQRVQAIAERQLRGVNEASVQRRERSAWTERDARARDRAGGSTTSDFEYAATSRSSRWYRLLQPAGRPYPLAPLRLRHDLLGFQKTNQSSRCGVVRAEAVMPQAGCGSARCRARS